jgi:hypothetical protein
MSQNWRTNYLLPCRGCLNVHEKKMEKMFPTKKKIFLLLLLTVIQCKQRYIRRDIFIFGGGNKRLRNVTNWYCQCQISQRRS